jgi:hypothetical protein
MRLKAKGEEIGTVEARDAEAAVRIAIELFEVTSPHDQRRLLARREG